jgi:hypothetical protein
MFDVPFLYPACSDPAPWGSESRVHAGNRSTLEVRRSMFDVPFLYPARSDPAPWGSESRVHAGNRSTLEVRRSMFDVPFLYPARADPAPWASRPTASRRGIEADPIEKPPPAPRRRGGLDSVNRMRVRSGPVGRLAFRAAPIQAQGRNPPMGAQWEPHRQVRPPAGLGRLHAACGRSGPEGTPTAPCVVGGRSRPGRTRPGPGGQSSPAREQAGRTSPPTGRRMY